MYTSGTTGDPKGVMISNNSIVTLIAGVKCLLERVNVPVSTKCNLLPYLFDGDMARSQGWLEALCSPHVEIII